MEKPIRVLQVVNSMGMGGAENFIMNIYRKIDKTKVQFDFAVHTKEPAFFDEEIKSLGGNLYYFPKYNGKNLFTYRKAWQEFLNQHPEIKAVHGHIGSSAAIYLQVAKQLGRKTIAHSHSANDANEKSLKNLLWEVSSFPTRYVSEFRFACGYKAGVKRFGGKFQLTDTCNKIIHNGINLENFIFNEETRKTVRKDLTEETKVIGHIGRFTGEKNHTFLIDILNELIKKDPHYQLWLLGDGPLRKEMTEKVKSLKLEPYVKFLGIQKNVAPYLMGMDLFVMPSLYEGIPVSLIEAQSTGLPCVISDEIDPEVDVTGNVTIVPLKESAAKWQGVIEEQLQIVKPRKEMAEKVKAAGYSSTEIAKELMAFYLGK